MSLIFLNTLLAILLNSVSQENFSSPAFSIFQVFMLPCVNPADTDSNWSWVGLLIQKRSWCFLRSDIEEHLCCCCCSETSTVFEQECPRSVLRLLHTCFLLITWFGVNKNKAGHGSFVTEVVKKQNLKFLLCCSEQHTFVGNDLIEKGDIAF